MCVEYTQHTQHCCKIAHLTMEVFLDKQKRKVTKKNGQVFELTSPHHQRAPSYTMCTMLYYTIPYCTLPVCVVKLMSSFPSLQCGFVYACFLSGLKGVELFWNSPVVNADACNAYAVWVVGTFVCPNWARSKSQGNFESPVILTCMWLDCVTKPKRHSPYKRSQQIRGCLSYKVGVCMPFSLAYPWRICQAAKSANH